MNAAIITSHAALPESQIVAGVLNDEILVTSLIIENQMPHMAAQTPCMIAI